ncbi:RpiB/LacA/LacB family sugar-phosphate isomerase [Sebaldella sp. S0638]|uniref:RpiB/LacA/LacB family sugar-phosphate isomerase n=1 Tax=Sebaldella sp. S0638 TaxID=2957809 RepID=UPI00209D9D3F|nr:RpiB/LacA/LacB family sugar-phosphate isomerase [Sebaldella sp. S0638]MCP1222789.1 RpiB/LacA/LacB family sugar-phosphate isomerase [Sebaldella sp. S0638]
MKIGIGSSDGGVYLKEKIMEYLLENGYETVDYKEDGNDIFNISCSIAKAVMNGDIEKGIIIDDYGIAPFMICTKHKKIVCAQMADEHSAKMTRDHNNTSIITIGYEITGENLAKSICGIFAKSDYSGGRHQVRVDMLDKM